MANPRASLFRAVVALGSSLTPCGGDADGAAPTEQPSEPTPNATVSQPPPSASGDPAVPASPEPTLVVSEVPPAASEPTAAPSSPAQSAPTSPGTDEPCPPNS